MRKYPVLNPETFQPEFFHSMEKGDWVEVIHEQGLHPDSLVKAGNVYEVAEDQKSSRIILNMEHGVGYLFDIRLKPVIRQGDLFEDVPGFLGFGPTEL